MGIWKSIKKAFSKAGTKKAKKRQPPPDVLEDPVQDPLGDPLIGSPTDVERAPQPLQELAKRLAGDPQAMSLLRFDGMTLKLDTTALQQDGQDEQVDPEAPGLASPGQVLDLGSLPPPKPFWEKTSTDGANGYVCRATTKDGRPVVVKRPYIVPGETADEPPQVYPIEGDVDRTLAARMLAGADVRPHMVDILASGTAQTVWEQDDVRHPITEQMVVMGALEETLDKRMSRDGPLSTGETTRHGSTLLKVIAALQRAGLAHNDLKSDNLMFDAAGELVLIDFGELTSRDGAFPQGTGALATWSPNYQAETGDKKDSWAAGLNLLAMLRGEKTSDIGGRFMECTSEDEVTARLDEELGAGDEDDEERARLASTIRGLLRFDEGERWDAQTALEHLSG
ncbi:MAG TPA: phosphotransferase [Myxococcota bacterium]|nr:phosphotransferase [Myxococcota bacterium]